MVVFGKSQERICEGEEWAAKRKSTTPFILSQPQQSAFQVSFLPPPLLTSEASPKITLFWLTSTKGPDIRHGSRLHWSFLVLDVRGRFQPISALADLPSHDPRLAEGSIWAPDFAAGKQTVRSFGRATSHGVRHQSLPPELGVSAVHLWATMYFKPFQYSSCLSTPIDILEEDSFTRKKPDNHFAG
jgi:hypothetical protein